MLLTTEQKQKYCGILGVPVDSNSETVKKAYKKKSRILHPDKNKASDAKEQFQALCEAYSALREELESSKASNSEFLVIPTGVLMTEANRILSKIPQYIADYTRLFESDANDPELLYCHYKFLDSLLDDLGSLIIHMAVNMSQSRTNDPSALVPDIETVFSTEKNKLRDKLRTLRDKFYQEIAPHICANLLILKDNVEYYLNERSQTFGKSKPQTDWIFATYDGFAIDWIEFHPRLDTESASFARNQLLAEDSPFKEVLSASSMSTDALSVDFCSLLNQINRLNARMNDSNGAEVYSLKRELLSYIQRRAENPERDFGMFGFGYTRHQNLAAATCLYNALSGKNSVQYCLAPYDDRHGFFGAMQSGELGKIYNRAKPLLIQYVTGKAHFAQYQHMLSDDSLPIYTISYPSAHLLKLTDEEEVNESKDDNISSGELFKSENKIHVNENMRSVALLDVDQTLLFGTDNGGELNTALLDALQKAGIYDVYLFTDMQFKKESILDGIPDRIDLIHRLEERGFSVHGCITPNDLAWHYLTDKSAECQALKSVLFQPTVIPPKTKKGEYEALETAVLREEATNSEVMKLGDLRRFIQAITPEIPASEECGSGFHQASTEWNISNHVLSEQTELKSNVAKMLAEDLKTKKGYAHTKALLLELFMRDKPDWVSDIVIADDNEKVLQSLQEYKNRCHTCQQEIMPITVIPVAPISRRDENYYTECLQAHTMEKQISASGKIERQAELTHQLDSDQKYKPPKMFGWMESASTKIDRIIQREIDGANCGHAESCNALATRLMRGDGGLSKDLDTAEQLFQLAFVYAETDGVRDHAREGLCQIKPLIKNHYKKEPEAFNKDPRIASHLLKTETERVASEKKDALFFYRLALVYQLRNEGSSDSTREMSLLKQAKQYTEECSTREGYMALRILIESALRSLENSALHETGYRSSCIK